MTGIDAADARSAGLGLAETLLPLHEGERAVWHYEKGLLLQAVREAGLVWDRPDLVRRVDETVASFVLPDPVADFPEGVRIRGYRLAEYNLDQINPGKNLLPLMEADGTGRIRRAVALLLRQLENQPRTASGGYWHKLIYPDQMWLDGLYMAEPFLVRFAAISGETALFAETVRQFSLAESAMRDPGSGLLSHGWDESRRQAWADPVTGRSPHFWGRAMGWFVMALVDCLEWIPSPHPAFLSLLAILRRTSDSMIRYRDSVTGLWWQVVDMPERAGNYLEASVSAMMSFALGKAVRLGFLPESPFSGISRDAFRGCVDRFLSRDDSGGWHISGICSVAGLGGIPYRDGSYEYYIREPVKSDDCKGAGPFILAATEQWLREGAFLQ